MRCVPMPALLAAACLMVVAFTWPAKAAPTAAPGSVALSVATGKSPVIKVHGRGVRGRHCRKAYHWKRGWHRHKRACRHRKHRRRYRNRWRHSRHFIPGKGCYFYKDGFRCRF